jgi:FkbH-like protein
MRVDASQSQSDHHQRKLTSVAAVLRRRRRDVAIALKDSIAAWEKFAPSLASMGCDAFVEWETIPLADLLIESFATDESAWQDLFVGERMKQLHWPADTLDEVIERRERIFGADCRALLKLIEGSVPEEDFAGATRRLNAMVELVTTAARSSREVKVLLVGDCLFLDLTTFLTAPLLSRGITLRPTFASSKNPIELRNVLRSLAQEKFDLVCYSPYSYEFSPTLAETHYLQRMIASPRTLRQLAANAHRQVAPTLRLLQGTFSCTVFVHATANLRRHNSTLVSCSKSVATRLARGIAASEVNRLLVDEIALQDPGVRQPVLIDERALTLQYGELALGRKFYDSEPVHYTEMSRRLAEVYGGIIASRALTGKKIIVLDLDNTLWDGVIGEGAVTHYRERQEMLRRLRHKGILLAVASKNDPKNVRWDGAVLGTDDFVAQQIHWEPKHLSIRRIADELNLKVKDFVFIDDRPDEREMVAAAAPGISCLDATDAFTWDMLDWWEKSLGEQQDEDRTKIYQERRLRQEHLDHQAEAVDQEALLTGLGLRVEVRQVEPGKIARAAELINRTNQFNTCGSRVSTQEVAEWANSTRHRVLVAEAADKFGGMGLISVMALTVTEEALEIPVWVLSCRVFGLGVEQVILNAVSRAAAQTAKQKVRGFIRETANNQPCRNVYRDYGFLASGEAWELNELTDKIDPAWIVVTCDDTLFVERSPEPARTT